MGSLTKYWIYNETISNITFDNGAGWLVAKARREETMKWQESRLREPTTTTAKMTESGWEGSYLYRLMLASCGGLGYGAHGKRNLCGTDEGRKMPIKRSWNQNKSHLPTHYECEAHMYDNNQLLLRCGRCQRRKKKLALLSISISRLEPKGKENTDLFTGFCSFFFFRYNEN